MRIKLHARVVNTQSGVRGVVVKQYYPTGCAQQTMVLTGDGRFYHAPTATWRLEGAGEGWKHENA